MKITTADVRRGALRFLARVFRQERDPATLVRAIQLARRRLREQEANDRVAAREEAWYGKATMERTRRLYQRDRP
jgi:hypothetical protein